MGVGFAPQRVCELAALFPSPTLVTGTDSDLTVRSWQEIDSWGTYEKNCGIFYLALLVY
jgi:hypothetical protein